MIISKKLLKKIIRAQLAEQTHRQMIGPDSELPGKEKVQNFKKSSSENNLDLMLLLGEILLGLTPVGIVFDVNDAYNAYMSDDMFGMFLALAGVVPGVSEARKLKRLIDSGDVQGVVGLVKKFAKKNTSKALRIIRGTEKIKSELVDVIKDDGIYHVHTITRPEFTDDVLAHGVALRKNRAAVDVPDEVARKQAIFRATTHNNDMGSATIDQLRRAPFSFTNNKVTVIYELPPGKSLKDIVVPFVGVQRDSKYGKFIGNISNEYLKAYVDRRGEEDLLYILK